MNDYMYGVLITTDNTKILAWYYLYKTIGGSR